MVTLADVDILDHVLEALVELKEKLCSHLNGCNIVSLKRAFLSEEVLGDFKVTNAQVIDVSVFKFACNLLVELGKNLVIFIRLELLDFL